MCTCPTKSGPRAPILNPGTSRLATQVLGTVLVLKEHETKQCAECTQMCTTGGEFKTHLLKFSCQFRNFLNLASSCRL